MYRVCGLLPPGILQPILISESAQLFGRLHQFELWICFFPDHFAHFAREKSHVKYGIRVGVGDRNQGSGKEYPESSP